MFSNIEGSLKGIRCTLDRNGFLEGRVRDYNQRVYDIVGKVEFSAEASTIMTLRSVRRGDQQPEIYVATKTSESFAGHYEGFWSVWPFLPANVGIDLLRLECQETPIECFRKRLSAAETYPFWLKIEPY